MSNRLKVILYEDPGLALDGDDMSKLALQFVRETGQEKKFLRYVELLVHDHLEIMVTGTSTQVVSKVAEQSTGTFKLQTGRR